MSSFSVNTNVGALTALQQINRTNTDLLETQNRVNTGLEVRGAKDNAGLFAIAQNLRADLRGFDAVRQSIDRASSTLDIGLAAAESISDLLIEAQEKIVAASDEGIDEKSREALNTDFQAILSQIDTIAESAEFNGTKLISKDPDNITAITDPTADPNRVVRIEGQDLTTQGNSATRESTIIGTGGTLNDIGVTVTNFQALSAGGAFDPTSADGQAFLRALETAGDDDNVIQEDENGNLTLDFSNLTPIEGTGTTDNEFFRISFDGGEISLTTTEAADGSVTVGDLSPGSFVNSSGALSVEFKTGQTTQSTASLFEIDLEDPVHRAQAIRVLTNYSENVNDVLIRFGAGANTLEAQRDFVTRISDTVEVGIGNLVDADLARESAQLQALQVQQQLGVQALSIANGQPQIILSLFGN